MPGSSTARLLTAAPDTAGTRIARRTASERDDNGDSPHASNPVRSGAWPRQVRVEITRTDNQLRVALVGRSSPRSRAVARAIQAHLREAEEVIRRPRWYKRCNPVDWWRGTSIEQAYRSLHAARVFLVELVGDENLDALVPGVLARAQSSLPANESQRIEAELTPTAGRKIKRADLIYILERVYAASDEAHTHIRRFRNVLLLTAAFIAAFTLLLICGVANHPAAVPLCFQPDITTAQAATLAPNQMPGGHRLVCPSGEQAMGTDPLPSGLDVWIIAGLGLLGGGLASAISVRKIAGSATPYDVPIALALLKVPTGALTAVAGILLLGGGFVPGLSELDTQRQILAYALVFGYAQQLATRYLDARATTLLADVTSSPSGSHPTPRTNQRQQSEPSSSEPASTRPEAVPGGDVTQG
jgi:hypothetical protein